MTLRVLLPYGVFVEEANVLRLVVETPGGSIGFLPHRRDCVAALAAGLVSYETEPDGEKWVAVDRGVLVKTGPVVTVSVRRAIGGADLSQLRQAVDRQFLALSEREETVRAVVARLETGFLRRLASFHHA